MKHIKKLTLTIITFAATLIISFTDLQAQAWLPDPNNNPEMNLSRNKKNNPINNNWEDQLNINFAPQIDDRGNTRQQAGDNIYTTTTKTVQPDNFVELPKEEKVYTINDKVVDQKTYEENLNKDLKKPENPPKNPKRPIQDVSGCSANYGLFSGLIAAGNKIFTGLRELIYVVAGFGIIGVSVGGFFGNLNYKWLGAIVISLVIIATTGELINAITGCETFTKNVITDTLK